MKEEIINRIIEMLAIPEKNGEDVDIGSFYYDVAAMYALEEDYLKEYANKLSKNIFITSCDEETLLKIGEQMGIPRILETTATSIIKLSGPEGTKIPQGTEITSSTTGTKYLTNEVKTLEAIPTEVSIICGTPGSIGNQEIAQLDQCNINGVTVIQDKIIMNGTDLEEISDYRIRLLSYLKKPKRSGNKNHVCLWAEEFLGIGRARCISVWNGPGTLKLLALNSNFEPIDENKRQELHYYIDDQLSDFAELTTEIPTIKTIDFTLECSLHTDYTVEILRDELSEIITNYFKSISFNNEDNIVSIMDLISLVNSAPGINYLKTLTLNNLLQDVLLLETEIPQVGNIIITEV